MMRQNSSDWNCLIFTPAATLGKPRRMRAWRLSESINCALESTSAVTAVIENTAGQGTQSGLPLRAPGSDHRQGGGQKDRRLPGYLPHFHRRIRSAHHGSVRQNIGEFAEIVGFEYLVGVHLNDSNRNWVRASTGMRACAGKLGWEVFRYIMNDNRFEEIPMVLETVDDSLWPEEIRQLCTAGSQEADTN